MARIAAVLLAAGASRRFGASSKLLADIGGAPLIRRVVREVIESGVAETIAVTEIAKPNRANAVAMGTTRKDGQRKRECLRSALTSLTSKWGLLLRSAGDATQPTA